MLRHPLSFSSPMLDRAANVRSCCHMADLELRKLATADVIVISGRFTLEDKSAFLDITEKLDLANRGIGLDCGKMNYIDSSGIGDFLRLRTQAANFNKPLVFGNLEESVRKTFVTAQLASVFQILSAEDFKTRFPQ